MENSLEVSAELLSRSVDLSILDNMADHYYQVNAEVADTGEVNDAMLDYADEFAAREFGKQVIYLCSMYGFVRPSMSEEPFFDLSVFGEFKKVVATNFLESPAGDESNSLNRNGLGLLVEPIDKHFHYQSAYAHLHGAASLFEEVVLPLNNNVVSVTPVPFSSLS